MAKNSPFLLWLGDIKILNSFFSYLLPADNKNEQKCFTLKMGNRTSIVTQLLGVDNKDIPCGGPPEYNIDFDNRKDGKKLWQFFMDISPVFETMTLLTSRGGGPNCGIFIKMVMA